MFCRELEDFFFKVTFPFLFHIFLLILVYAKQPQNDRLELYENNKEKESELCIMPKKRLKACEMYVDTGAAI